MKKIHKILISLVLLLSVGIGTYLLIGNKVTEAKTPYKEITQKQLQEKISNNEKTIVYYYKKDCQYCKQASPLIKNSVKAFKADIYQIEVDKYDGIWEERNMVGTPTIVYYKGGYEISRLEGVKTQEMYNRWFSAMKKVN
ncbi:thioredoxin family protein [Bacillus sp. OAE603]|uniref:thioredoxin family protein n=1 Tax=Gottfriedia sp. OAE603 TaxID=2663872 RepID=UPI00178B263D